MGDKISLKDVVNFYAEGRRNFRNADFSGVDFKRVNLQDADLQGVYFRWAELQGANLKAANLSWADLQKANLSDAILHKATLKEANLKGACLQWVDLTEASLQGAQLIKSDLSFANLRAASLRLAKLEQANLDKANLNGVDLRVAVLQSAHLSDADIQCAKLQEANLSQANLTGANLEGANLQGAKADLAILVGANLTGASLQHASLKGANLQDAKLFGANLDGANLQDARLPGIDNMLGASLKGANLQGVKLPSGQDLLKAMLPNGSIPDDREASAIAPVKAKAQPGEDSTLETKEEVSRMAQRYAQTPRTKPVSGGGAAAKTTGALSPEGAIAPEPTPEIIQTSDRPPIEEPQTDPIAELPVVAAQQRIDSTGYLTGGSIAIAHRRGPSEFRQNLLAAYDGCCTITGCDAEPVLEGFYLLLHGVGDPNHPSVGLLLRSDVHTLCDLYLLAIDPDAMTIRIAPKLRHTSYGELHGKALRAPIAPEFKPTRTALLFHWNLCRWVRDSP